MATLRPSTPCFGVGKDALRPCRCDLEVGEHLEEVDDILEGHPLLLALLTVLGGTEQLHVGLKGDLGHQL